MEKITIIGAGIAGLSLAIALQKKGIDFEIYESFESFKDLGAGIMLANNAMQVYHHLDLNSEIAKKGRVYNSLNITDGKLNYLSSINTNEYSKHKINSYAIHRSSLQQILLDCIPSEKLFLGKKVKSIIKKEKISIIKFEDKTEVEAEIIIGADGIHSKVRNSIFPDSKIRNAKQVCWRGIATFSLPEKYDHKLHEIWAEGKRFGFVQIARDKVYWYALKDSNKRDSVTINQLTELYKNYDPLVNEIILNTPENNLLTNEMKDLQPLSLWFKDNICLIGDAAHATTPNMGQGACQSIEDVYILSEEICKHKNINDAFLKFQNRRIGKANKVTNMSWKVGKVAHYSNPIAVSIRNLMIKHSPDFMIKKQNEFLFNIE